MKGAFHPSWMWLHIGLDIQGNAGYLNCYIYKMQWELAKAARGNVVKNAVLSHQHNIDAFQYGQANTILFVFPAI